MGLLSNFFKNLFGSNKGRTEPTTVADADYTSKWEKERAERISAAEARLKDWLVRSIQSKGRLSFSWESGNDEAFVTFEDHNDAEEENFVDLEEYIVDKLDIPDAGEFQMNGTGIIYLENNLVRAKYSSSIKSLIDFDEETEEEIYGEEEFDSGDTVLFNV